MHVPWSVLEREVGAGVENELDAWSLAVVVVPWPLVCCFAEFSTNEIDPHAEWDVVVAVVAAAFAFDDGLS